MTHEDLYNLICDPTTRFFLLGVDHIDTHVTYIIFAPLEVPHAPNLSSFGAPTSRVGFPSTTSPSRVAKVMAKKDVELATKAECTTSSGEVSTSRVSPYGE